MKAQLVLAAAMFLASCEPCAGTPSCRTEPEISYTGQFIEFPSGRPVAGVHVLFAPQPGPLLADTVRALSDGDGFFVLRAPAVQDGIAEGALIVRPPPPRSSYTVQSIRLSTHRKRGDGGVLGRLMVNPYLQYIGELRDRKTSAPVPNASVMIRQVGSTLVKPESIAFTSAENGRFMWEPSVTQFGVVVFELEVTAAGYPRSYLIRDTVQLQYRDEPPRLKAFAVGDGWSYTGVLLRRGTYQPIPGIVIDFERTGGIDATPDRFTATPDAGGSFPFPLEPIGAGTLFGQLTIRPPGGQPLEVVPDVKLETFTESRTRLLPFFYGPATIARPVFLDRATDLPVRRGTHVRFTHVGGLSTVIPAPWGVPIDSGIRIVDSTGTVGYDVATNETGVVMYDMEARLNSPHDWETIRAAPFSATRSDKPAVDTFRVGRWLPWTGTLRDATTNSAIGGATVTFQRISGGRVSPATFVTTSGSDGRFAIQPAPLDRDTVVASLRINAGAMYRDTTLQVRLHSVQRDTSLSIGVVLVRPVP